MKHDDPGLENLIIEAFAAEVAERSIPAFTGTVSRSLNRKKAFNSVGRFAAAAGIAGLFWLGVLTREESRLDIILADPACHPPSLEIIIRRSALFVRVALMDNAIDNTEENL